MSGIAGVFFRDGRPVPGEILERMANAMPYRGVDGIQIYHSGNIGFVQSTLASSNYSTGPIESGANRQSISIGDLRLDNRKELFGSLGIDASANEDMSDRNLVGLLHQKHDSGFIDRVDGDFAIAVYDSSNDTLSCYRDHFGSRPLYYSLTDDAFLFASDIKALLCTGFVTTKINRRHLEDFIVGSLANIESTIYQSIQRIPPGSYITVSRDTLRRTQYWSLDDVAEIQGEENALVEGFRERFTCAVTKRLQTPASIACMLSGGLDSSSVVATSAEILQDATDRFTTYSVSFPYLPSAMRKRTDESAYVQSVRRSTGIRGVDLSGDSANPLDTLERMVEVHDQPFAVPNAYLDFIALTAAKSDGNKVLLTGLEGDLTVSHGDGYLTELGHQGRWDEFCEASRAIAGRTMNEPMLFYNRYAVPVLDSLATQRRLGDLNHAIRSLSKQFGNSRYEMLWKAVIRPRLGKYYRMMSRSETNEEAASLRFVKKDYAQRNQLLARITENGRELYNARSQQDLHKAYLSSGYAASLLQFSEKNASNWGIEARHPFFDRELVEYSVSLPGWTKLHNGWPRYVLRASMAHILPDEVRWRAQKAVLAPNFGYLMNNASEERIRHLVTIAVAEFPDLIDKSNVFRLLSRNKYATLWRILVLGSWILHKRG